MYWGFECTHECGEENSLKFVRGAFALVGFVVILGLHPASSQEAVRIRATIERVEGPTLIIKERDGPEQKLTAFR
jgi:uncharacterized protein (UPF0212 family)